MPEGEELVVQSVQPPPQAVVLDSQQILVDGIDRTQRRSEFKRQVSALAAKCIESYRKRFFPNPNDYTNFLRKVINFFITSREEMYNILGCFAGLDP